MRHIFPLVITVSAIILIYAAYLYWPSDNPPKPITSTASTQQDSQPNQRGTDKIPLIVKVLPAPYDQGKAQDERDEKHTKAVNEHTLVWATVLLAVFTFFLACFTAYIYGASLN